MSKQQREPMTSVDAAWLEMDRTTNPMVINGLMLFASPIDYSSLSRLLNERLVREYARFRQRPVAISGTGQRAWEPDPHFHLSYHLHHIALPAPGVQATLQSVVGQLMSEPLDRRRPLWRFYLIDNVEGGSAVFGRIHHCIADGVALMQVLLSLTDTEPEPKPKPSGAVPPAPARSPNPLLTPLRLAAGVGLRTARILGNLRPGDREQLFSREQLLKSAQAAGLLSATSAAILAKLLVMAPDRPSIYRGELNGIRRVAWSKPLSLNTVKQIGRATGTTVNDVLVAAVAGALRRDMEVYGDQPDFDDLRAMVPMNLRHPGAELRLGNEFTLLYLALPVSLDQPYARLAAVKRRMDILKHSPEPFLVYQILNIIGRLPGEVAHQAVDWFADKASCVLTNVPGPRQPLYFAGQRLARMLFWVPHSGDIGMGISIFSYAGTVTIGLDVDEALVPNPERIVDQIQAEFDALVEFGHRFSQAAEIAIAVVDAGQQDDRLDAG